MKTNLRFTPSRHTSLTQAANRGILDDTELADVCLANIAQDLDQTSSQVHFDNCTFPQGVAHIDALWQIIEGVDRLDTQTLGTFGRLLHTVQDFYSHSNWVELNVAHRPIPVWDLALATLPSGAFSGTWLLGTPKACKAGTPSHSELNKDSPSSEEGAKIVESGPNAGETLYALAYDAAERATRVQFDRLAAKFGRKPMHGGQRALDVSMDPNRLIAIIDSNRLLRDVSVMSTATATATEKEKQTMTSGNKPGLLHEPEHLRSLANQLRAEASRCEARASRLERGEEAVGCSPGCWNVLSTCIQVQPL